MSDWVDVRDRLPEINQVVLVTLFDESWNDKPRLDTGGRYYMCNEGWYWCHGEKWSALEALDSQDPIEVDVTHWMPLPEPFQTTPRQDQSS